MSNRLSNVDLEHETKHALFLISQQYGRQHVADELGISIRTLERWNSKGVPHPKILRHALDSIFFPSFRSSSEASFTFIDLFAGIGGTRLGFEAVGGECVWTSEWNKFSQQTYCANFPSTRHGIAGDITQADADSVPDHDVLIAGFPCQPFSVAGVSKKNSLGQSHGFACETQGTLFFDIVRILHAKRPHAFLLENVKNLSSHDKGRTFRTMLRVLTEELGYEVCFRTVDAKAFVPQHRERIFIVGFREGCGYTTDSIHVPQRESPCLEQVLHPEDGSEESEPHYTAGAKGAVDSRYVLSNKLWTYLRGYAAKHRAKGNGFGYGLVNRNQQSRTLSARYHKDGSEILISRGKRQNPRRLTPRECARLMGFPDNFKIPVSDTQAYRQFGNSVVMPVVKAVAESMYPYILEAKQKRLSGQRALAV